MVKVVAEVSRPVRDDQTFLGAPGLPVSTGQDQTETEEGKQYSDGLGHYYNCGNKSDHSWTYLLSVYLYEDYLSSKMYCISSIWLIIILIKLL